MSETTIQVNFGRPMPLFPLNGLALMPHGLAPLHVFEPRYRQLVSDVLEGEKQIAMAMFEGDAWRHEYHGRPPIRPVVCVGHVIQHDRIGDGRYFVVLQGLCREEIIQELPADDALLYRRAFVMPLEMSEPDESRLEVFRDRIAGALEHDRLSDLRDAGKFVEHLKDPEIPTSVILEVLGFTFLTDSEARYKLLAMDDVVERAAFLSSELMLIQSLLRRAVPQRLMDQPKGCHWN